MIRRMALGMLAVCVGCASGADKNAGKGAFTVRMGDKSFSFNCEVQTVHPASQAVVKTVPVGQGPSDKSIKIEGGRELITWLYHFEDDGSQLKDQEAAYSVAISMPKPATGHFEIPSKSVALLFFCDNWGSGFRSVEARAVRGWIKIDAASDIAVAGSFSVGLSGNREKSRGRWEPVTLELQGEFSARR